ncbi:MAG: hypothetical protein ACE5I7_20865 [Candidatus Binatia bacterium]
MATTKLRREAGQGGKLGHSYMGHYGKTEEIKLAAKKRRRAEAKRAIEEELREMECADRPGRQGTPANLSSQLTSALTCCGRAVVSRWRGWRASSQL